nr:metalloregulator ArsR/SmtB family transcription factor [Dorea longicatena]
MINVRCQYECNGCGFDMQGFVQMLSDGEKCGCKLLERFEITQPTLSHHMKILVGCGLVNDRKEGKWHHYSLNCETLMNYKHFIESLTCSCYIRGSYSGIFR